MQLKRIAFYLTAQQLFDIWYKIWPPGRRDDAVWINDFMPISDPRVMSTSSCIPIVFTFDRYWPVRTSKRCSLDVLWPIQPLEMGGSIQNIDNIDTKSVSVPNRLMEEDRYFSFRFSFENTFEFSCFSFSNLPQTRFCFDLFILFCTFVFLLCSSCHRVSPLKTF